MIIEQTGNILDSTCDLIVITVNTQGVMGAGLASMFKKHYPAIAEDYRDECLRIKRKGGDIFWGALYNQFLFFCTKEHWKNPSKLEWIESGLKELSDMYQDVFDRLHTPLGGTNSIAIPPLGCGLGGLNWDDVYPLIQKYLGNIEGLTVHVYLPR